MPYLVLDYKPGHRAEVKEVAGCQVLRNTCLSVALTSCVAGACGVDLVAPLTQGTAV